MLYDPRWERDYLDKLGRKGLRRLRTRRWIGQALANAGLMPMSTIGVRYAGYQKQVDCGRAPNGLWEGNRICSATGIYVTLFDARETTEFVRSTIANQSVLRFTESAEEFISPGSLAVRKRTAATWLRVTGFQTPQVIPLEVPLEPLPEIDLRRLRTRVGTDPTVPAPARRRVLPARRPKVDPMLDPVRDPAREPPRTPEVIFLDPPYWRWEIGFAGPGLKPRDPETSPLTESPPNPQSPTPRPMPGGRMKFDYKPPKRYRSRVRERKLRNESVIFRVGLFKALDKISEASEIIDALWKAIPEDLRVDKGKRGPIDAAGQYGIDGADWKIKQVYKHWDSIDWNAALVNLAANGVEDAVIGAIQRRVKQVYPGPSSSIVSPEFGKVVSKESERLVRILDEKRRSAAGSARVRYNEVRARLGG